MPWKPTRRLTASRRQFYDVKPIVWARDQGLCVVCGARGFTWHHRRPRGMGGSSHSPVAHSPAHLVVVCRDCHDHLETQERAWAYANGFLVRRGITDLSEVPVQYFDGWALLDHDGNRLFVTEPTNTHEGDPA